MLSTVPATAVAAEMRPPRRRYLRSSKTVEKWPEFSFIALSKRTSSGSITSSPVITIPNWVDSSTRMPSLPQVRVC